jgi:AraC-like DNA-binding protein/ligand-binding sensor domain-containing protein/CheY-like chemotaxis protein
MTTRFCKYIIFIICLMIIHQAAFADNFVIKNISNTDGLSNNSVNCIFEDSHRTMWFGTWGGLNSYNGRDIKTYRYNGNNTYSISNNVIRQILEVNGYIWISTDNGVNRINRVTGQISRYYPHTNSYQIPKTEKTFILAKDNNSNIYCWIKNKGLFIFNKVEFKYINTDFFRKVKCFNIYGTTLVLLFYDGSLRTVNISYNRKSLKESELSVIGHDISNIFINNNHAIATSGKNILFYDEYIRCNSEIPIPEKWNISQILYFKGKLYVCFIGAGCKIYDMKTKKWFDQYGIDKNASVLSMFISSQKMIWLGTDGHGVQQIFKYNPLFKSIQSDFPIRCFCNYKNGNLLVGTKGAGLNILDLNRGELQKSYNESTGLLSNSVYSLCRNSKGDIFIGSDGYGINVLNANSNRLSRLIIPTQFPKFKSVYNMLLTNNETIIWAATAGYGLVRMTLQDKGDSYVVTGMKCFSSAAKSNPLNNDVIYAFSLDYNGSNIWFGTRGDGVNRLSMQHLSITRLEYLVKNNTLTNEDILCMYRDGNKLWIGTSFGLNLLQHTSIGFQIKKSDIRGLGSKTIHGIIKDKLGDIWVSTNDGLFKIDRSGRIENYSTKDGLQNNEFSDGAYFIDNNGTVYFGGVNGLNYFNPQTVHLRNFKPYIDLSSLRVNNKDTDLLSSFEKDGKIKLSYDERTVALKFIAKDYINNNGCEYAYRLDNDDTWIEMGTNPEIMLQLASGRHTIEVKCCNSDKIWSDNIYKLTIIVGSPWWFSMWAILLYILFLIITIIIVSKVVKNRIRIKRRLFLADINKKQEQKIYESKLAFFTNVAHELYTPLTLIFTPAQYLLELPNIDINIKRYLQIIKDNAGKMQKLMQELIEFRKNRSNYEPLCPEVIELHEFIVSIIKYYQTVENNHLIKFDVSTYSLSNMTSDKSVLSKIIITLLSDAFYNTKSDKSISMEVYQTAGENSPLHIRIKYADIENTRRRLQNMFNNYKIFDNENTDQTDMRNGVELNLMKKMIDYLEGTININKESGKYIDVDVVIPSLDMQRTEIIKIEKENKESHIYNDGNRERLHSETKVLVVEDEMSIRNLLVNILYDYTVKLFNNSNDAINSITMDHPDIIIMDLHLGEQIFNTINQLKDDAKTNYIPLIALSGNVSVEEQIEAYSRGIDIYIEKPFHPRQILSSIENLLTRQLLLRDYFNSSMSSLRIRDGKILHEDDIQFMDKVNQFIKEHISNEDLSPETIESYIGQSKASFYRKFKEVTDTTPSDYIKRARLEYAAKLLKTTRMTVSEIIYRTGFSNKSYFYREFKDLYNCSPNDYRKP